MSKLSSKQRAARLRGRVGKEKKRKVVVIREPRAKPAVTISPSLDLRLDKLAKESKCTCFHAPEQHGESKCEALNWTGKECPCLAVAWHKPSHGAPIVTPKKNGRFLARYCGHTAYGKTQSEARLKVIDRVSAEIPF